MTQHTLLTGLHIVLVEDDPHIGMALSSGLRACGAASVQIKASARQIKRLLCDRTRPLPHVVILDNDIVGDESGTDVAHWMCEQPHLADCVRISYSGTDPDALRAALTDPTIYHAMIVKPQPIEALASRIAAAVATATAQRT